jgi:hypothetical protein
MALTENKAIDKIEIVGLGVLQVREATTIMRDGAQIAKTYHRWSFVPGDDVSAMPSNVQAIAKAAWTQDVIEKYKAYLAEQEAIKAARTGGQS